MKEEILSVGLSTTTMAKYQHAILYHENCQIIIVSEKYFFIIIIFFVLIRAQERRGLLNPHLWLKKVHIVWRLEIITSTLIHCEPN